MSKASRFVLNEQQIVRHIKNVARIYGLTSYLKVKV